MRVIEEFGAVDYLINYIFKANNHEHRIEGNPNYERDIGKQLNPQGVYLFRRLVKDLNLDFGFIGNAKSKSLIRQRRDETVENQKHLLIDTEEPPLIWASLSDICGLERITVVEDFDEKFEEVA